MSQQDEINSAVTSLSASADAIALAIQAEADQVNAFITTTNVDTTALNGVAARLSAAATQISGIFTPPEPEVGPGPPVEDEPPVEDVPPADEPPVDEVPPADPEA